MEMKKKPAFEVPDPSLNRSYFDPLSPLIFKPCYQLKLYKKDPWMSFQLNQFEF